MRILLAIATCRAYRSRAEAQRKTWANDQIDGIDVRYFVGEGSDEPLHHETVLPCGDDYHALPDKTQEICRWALAHGYTHLIKTDDDIYLRPERALANIPGPDEHYVGRVRGPSGGNTRTPPFQEVMYPAPYCSGMFYWLSEKAMRVIAQAPRSEDIAEDRWVGNTLLKHGISPVHCDKLVLPQAKNAAVSGSEGPRVGNDIIAAGEYYGTHMYLAHEEFLNSVSDIQLRQRGLESMSRICILLKTFMRDGMIHRVTRNIERHLPLAKMIVVDDGMEHKLKVARYADLRSKGHECIWLPFDSGFGAKANAGVKVCDREYVLIASDDFNFLAPGTVEGIQRLVTVLDSDKTIGVASGRVDNRPYEGFLERKLDREGNWSIHEIPLPQYPHPCFKKAGGVAYADVDLTVNYCLVRREVFDYVEWDTDYKIGGDHATWMMDVKNAGFRIVYVHGVSISQIAPFPGSEHPNYGKYRARAKRALPLFFHKQNITKYVGFDGRVDEVVPSDSPIDWSI